MITCAHYAECGDSFEDRATYVDHLTGDHGFTDAEANDEADTFEWDTA